MNARNRRGRRAGWRQLQTPPPRTEELKVCGFRAAGIRYIIRMLTIPGRENRGLFPGGAITSSSATISRSRSKQATEAGGKAWHQISSFRKFFSSRIGCINCPWCIAGGCARGLPPDAGRRNWSATVHACAKKVWEVHQLTVVGTRGCLFCRPRCGSAAGFTAQQSDSGSSAVDRRARRRRADPHTTRNNPRTPEAAQTHMIAASSTGSAHRISRKTRAPFAIRGVLSGGR